MNAKAAELLAARRARTAFLRRSGVAAVLSTFALAFGVVTTHGAAGTTSTSTSTAVAASPAETSTAQDTWTESETETELEPVQTSQS